MIQQDVFPPHAGTEAKKFDAPDTPDLPRLTLKTLWVLTWNVISRRGGDGGGKPQGYISTPEASVYRALSIPWETPV